MCCRFDSAVLLWSLPYYTVPMVSRRFQMASFITNLRQLPPPVYQCGHLDTKLSTLYCKWHCRGYGPEHLAVWFIRMMICPNSVKRKSYAFIISVISCMIQCNRAHPAHILRLSSDGCIFSSRWHKVGVLVSLRTRYWKTVACALVHVLSNSAEFCKMSSWILLHIS